MSATERAVGILMASHAWRCLQDLCKAGQGLRESARDLADAAEDRFQIPELKDQSFVHVV